ncbi:MAG: M48 family metalloprotease, partial [Actinomycetota bacterium]
MDSPPPAAGPRHGRESARAEAHASRLRVTLLAALGHGVLGAAAAMVVLLGAGVVYLAFLTTAFALKLLIPLGALLVVLARAAWVRIEPPAGIPVEPADAPALFDLVASTRKLTGGPPVNRVVITDELNASIVQVPRFGPLGGQRNHLVLGLPLLEALPPDEFRAVLAHEYGHLTGRHGRWAARIYRVRASWLRLLQSLEERRRLGTALFRWFFAWYAPLFARASMAVAREHEYGADAVAADATSAAAAGRALVRVHLASEVLERRYWAAVARRAADEPAPPGDVYSAMAPALAAAGSLPESPEWARACLAVPGDEDDTHPPLAERLTALSLDPTEVVAAVAQPVTETAGPAFLGAARTRLLGRLDAEWAAGAETGWRQHREELIAARARIAEIDGLPPSQVDADLDVECGSLLEALGRDDEAADRYRSAVAKDAGHAAARFRLGAHLLSTGDDTGLDHLSAAMKCDPEAIVPACHEAIAYLEESGRGDEADPFRDALAERLVVLAQAWDERDGLRAGDRLEPHDLPESVVTAVADELAAFPEVGRAFLVRKRVTHLDDERPAYVLVVMAAREWRQAWRDLDDDATPLHERVAAALAETPLDIAVATVPPRGALRDTIAA